MLFAAQTAISALLIVFCSWLSGRRPDLAGYIIAMPFGSLLTLFFSHIQWGTNSNTIKYAQSIFYAVPISLLFFVPFLLAERLKLHFWACYLLGIALLVVGFFIHSFLVKGQSS